MLCLIVDINLKKASKTFSQKFSCGSSVSGDDEIIVQGDITDDLIELIAESFQVKMRELCSYSLKFKLLTFYYNIACLTT